MPNVGAAVSRVPASFFGIVIGIAALANAWRRGHAVWGLPATIGEALFVVAGLALALSMSAKWLLATVVARQEADHPVQCCFLGVDRR